MANNRQQSRKENATRFVTLQPDFSAFQFIVRDEKIYAEAIKQRTPNEQTDPVTYRRTHVRSDCPRYDYAGHAEVAAGCEKRRWRNDDLAGNRDNRAFHRHEQEDAGISEGADRVDQPHDCAMDHPGHYMPDRPNRTPDIFGWFRIAKQVIINNLIYFLKEQVTDE